MGTGKQYAEHTEKAHQKKSVQGNVPALLDSHFNQVHVSYYFIRLQWHFNVCFINLLSLPLLKVLIRVGSLHRTDKHTCIFACV